MALINGSFEGGWTRSTWTGVEYGEIFVPEGWTAFWREGGVPIPWDPLNLVGYARPEMAVINKEAPYLDPPRIYEGYRSVKWFSFYKIHDCGILQTVATQPGQLLTLTGYAHAWYSQRDDPTKSEYERDGVWYCLGDGMPGMGLILGIDPTGGRDPYADTVIWDEWHSYNSYDPIGPVMAFAEGTTATGWGMRFDERGQNTRARPFLLQWQGGRRLLPLRVFPFQYNPIAGTLRYYADLRVTVRVQGTGDRRSRQDIGNIFGSGHGWRLTLQG